MSPLHLFIETNKTAFVRSGWGHIILNCEILCLCRCVVCRIRLVWVSGSHYHPVCTEHSATRHKPSSVALENLFNTVHITECIHRCSV